MSAQLQAARERGRRDGLILLARLRHNIQFHNLRLGRLVDCPSPLNLNSGERYNLQQGVMSAQSLGVSTALGVRPAVLNLGLRLPLGTTGARTSFEAQ